MAGAVSKQNEHLPAQLVASELALDPAHLTWGCVRGPVGSGKSTVLRAIASGAVKRGDEVIALQLEPGSLGGFAAVGVEEYADAAAFRTRVEDIVTTSPGRSPLLLIDGATPAALLAWNEWVDGLSTELPVRRLMTTNRVTPPMPSASPESMFIVDIESTSETGTARGTITSGLGGRPKGWTLNLRPVPTNPGPDQAPALPSGTSGSSTDVGSSESTVASTVAAVAARLRLVLEEQDRRVIVDLIERTGSHAPVTEVVRQFQAGQLSPAVLTYFLPTMWEGRPDDSPVPAGVWRAMFEQAIYTEDCVVRRPRGGTVRAYRGATEENREGLSWTLDPEQARYFARYRQAPGTFGTVWAVNIPAERVHARYLRGMEREIVADVRGLEVVPFGELDRLPAPRWWHRFL